MIPVSFIPLISFLIFVIFGCSLILWSSELYFDIRQKNNWRKKLLYTIAILLLFVLLLAVPYHLVRESNQVLLTGAFYAIFKLDYRINPTEQIFTILPLFFTAWGFTAKNKIILFGSIGMFILWNTLIALFIDCMHKV